MINTNNSLEKIMLREGVYFFNRENDFIKDEHVYCKKCGERKDKDLINVFGVKRVLGRSCKCDREREKLKKEKEMQDQINLLKDRCFLSEIQKNYTFENYKGEYNQAYKVAKNYVKHFEKMKEDNIGLFLYGNVGSGKTYLSCSIANDIIEKYKISVKVRNLSQIINEIQCGGFELDKNQYIDRIVNVPLLILDDLGIERNTSYAKEQIYNIIDSRCLKNKPTIFTTNLSYDELKNEQNIEYKRIYSRILAMTLPVLIEGIDFREKIQREKLQKNSARLLESL